MKYLFLLSALLPLAALAAVEAKSLKLYPGYLTQIRCEGRLLVSAVGDDRMVRLEALPKDLGCGVLLKPLGNSGRTNLILETSTGTIRKIVVIEGRAQAPVETELRYFLKGVTQ
jgi:hypothetical protein